MLSASKKKIHFVFSNFITFIMQTNNILIYYLVPDELKVAPKLIKELFIEFYVFVKDSPVVVLLVLVIVGYYTHEYILDLDDNTSDAYTDPNTPLGTILEIFLWWWFWHILSYLCFAGLPVFYFLNSLKKAEEKRLNCPPNTQCKALVIIPTFKEMFLENFRWYLEKFAVFCFCMFILYITGWYPIICED